MNKMTPKEWKEQFHSLNYKWYGYEPGKEMLFKWNDPPCSIWKDCWLPAVVVAEYPKFIVIEVQPHKNVNQSLGMSKPYRVGVNKMNLLFKGMELREVPY